MNLTEEKKDEIKKVMNEPIPVKVFVVDDEPGTCETLADILKCDGYEVTTANSGNEALEILSGDSFDVLITDLVMENIDGITLTKIIRERGFDFPIIVMSGFGTIERAVESIKAGAWEFINKPFNSEHITMILRKVLETKRLRELAQESEYYKTLSFTDPMTGLANYRSLMETLKNELYRSKRYDHSLSFLIIDIDDFKICNDTWGHLTGDRVLKEVAGIIRKSIRGYDFAARYGGEEFAVVLTETKGDEALFAAERIRRSIFNYKFNTNDGASIDTPISVSIGVSSFPDNGATEKELIEAADKALYRSKREGKNQVFSSKPGLRAAHNLPEPERIMAESRRNQS